MKAELSKIDKLESNFEVEQLPWKFTRENGRVVVTGNVKCNNHIFKYHISFFQNKNKKKGLNGGRIRTLRIWDDVENPLAYFDNGWAKKRNTSELEAIIKHFSRLW